MVHALITPYPLLRVLVILFFILLKAKVNRSHPILQEKPLTSAPVAMAICPQLPLLPDRCKSETGSERELILSLRAHLANWERGDGCLVVALKSDFNSVSLI